MSLRRSETWGAGFKPGRYSLGIQSGAAFRLLQQPSSTFESLKSQFSELTPPQKQQLHNHPRLDTLLEEKEFSKSKIAVLKSILADTAVHVVETKFGDSLDQLMVPRPVVSSGTHALNEIRLNEVHQRDRINTVSSPPNTRANTPDIRGSVSNTRPLEDFVARRILGQLSKLAGDV